MEKKIRGFEVVREDMRKNKNVEIKLPQRGSKISAGYDFSTPIEVTIQPNESKLIWTDVKAYMQEGEVLIIDVRSSIGVKKGLMLSNTVGVIDADYYQNKDNDGNIGISLRNMSDKPVTLEAGERIAQGIFIPFLVADNGNTDKIREGGIGSTGTK
ncbi:dUTP diphosphatase [Clostridium botulinum C]|uniref:dCTP deaminase domain-containing protein n=1 Tax=Clostridium botulinum TaxID=1491 RepID=UPI001E51B8BB|nr:dUTP diphosphatase [Clostridium botulinum]MCD3216926.1 dUTP diphosphatase [Clostridium botulinum C]